MVNGRSTVGQRYFFVDLFVFFMIFSFFTEKCNMCYTSRDTHGVVSYARLQLRGRAFNTFKTMHGLQMPVMQNLCRVACIENSSTFRSSLTTPIKDVFHQVSITLRVALGVFYTHCLLLQQRFTLMLKIFDGLVQSLRKVFDFNLELMLIICSPLC